MRRALFKLLGSLRGFVLETVLETVIHVLSVLAGLHFSA